MSWAACVLQSPVGKGPYTRADIVDGGTGLRLPRPRAPVKLGICLRVECPSSTGSCSHAWCWLYPSPGTPGKGALGQRSQEWDKGPHVPPGKGVLCLWHMLPGIHYLLLFIGCGR